MKNTIRSPKKAKPAPHSRQTKNASLSSVLPSEMLSRYDWPEIIRPLAPRIIKANKILGIRWSGAYLVTAAIASYVYYAERHTHFMRRNPDGINVGNYSYMAQEKFPNFRVVNLADRFELLTVKMSIYLGDLIPLAINLFIEYALVNRIEAAELVFMIEDLRLRDDPAPLRDVVKIDLPEWVLDFCRDDKSSNETEEQFIARKITATVLSRRGYLQKEVA
jgi:hypothetical protein